MLKKMNIDRNGPIFLVTVYRYLKIFFCMFFCGLESVGHSFAYVAHFVF